MKRFLVFGGDNYYPRPAFGDFVSAHDASDEAILAANAFRHAEYPDFSWCTVVDTHGPKPITVYKAGKPHTDWERD